MCSFRLDRHAPHGTTHVTETFLARKGALSMHWVDVAVEGGARATLQDPADPIAFAVEVAAFFANLQT